MWTKKKSNDLGTKSYDEPLTLDLFLSRSPGNEDEKGEDLTKIETFRGSRESRVAIGIITEAAVAEVVDLFSQRQGQSVAHDLPYENLPAD